jgi:hypothetical protein
MKTKFRIPVMTLMAALLCAVVIVSCKDDDDDTPPAPTVDLTALKASITSANNLMASTEEGKNDGQYTVGSKATLTTAVTAAQAVVDNTATTQAQADAAKVSLDAAITAYQNAIITPIAEEALVAHWSFDEGTGTTAGDASDNEFDGEFVAGPMWPVADSDPVGGGMPEWAEDRTGAANKAIYFGETGGSIEVPYNTKLNPAKMTVSVWLNTDFTNPNNRFLGLQSWLGYKFQLQTTNRPYFTINTDEGIREEDATVELPENEWHHVVATFGDGKLTFYIDGELAKEWDKPGNGLALSGTTYNLVIGQDFPTDKYAAGDGAGFDDPESENYHVIPLAWGGHFRGSLDELRIYNTVLTEAQVGSLYDREKP